MDLYEAEGKRLFFKHGLPTDNGIFYNSEEDLERVAYPCVIKAQYLSGKRGKAGGIRFADNIETARDEVKSVENILVNGKAPSAIYITSKEEILEEHYISVTLDRVSGQFLVIYSPDGGMDIEQVSEETPECVIKYPVGDAFQKDAFIALVKTLIDDGGKAESIGDIAEQLISLCYEEDALLAEINPLAFLKQGRFCALDAKVSLDDNALGRHEDRTLIPRLKMESEREKQAHENGLAYVELGMGGNIGVLAGGAGIGMATVDAISHYDLIPYDFLDLGGGVTREKMEKAVSLLLTSEEVEGILINVFGGVNNCLTMAEGLCDALGKYGGHKPIVVKSRGFNQEEGWALLDGKDIAQVRYGTTDDAVVKLKEIMGR